MKWTLILTILLFSCNRGSDRTNDNSLETSKEAEEIKEYKFKGGLFGGGKVAVEGNKLVYTPSSSGGVLIDADINVDMESGLIETIETVYIGSQNYKRREEYQPEANELFRWEVDMSGATTSKVLALIKKNPKPQDERYDYSLIIIIGDSYLEYQVGMVDLGI